VENGQLRPARVLWLFVETVDKPILLELLDNRGGRDRREFGVVAAKDNLTPDQYTKLENQSEEKVLKAREPAAELAHKLLD